MAQETFYNLISQSMQESAQLVRSSLGRSSYVDIARESISSSINAGGGKITPSNWEIDEAQEREV